MRFSYPKLTTLDVETHAGSIGLILRLVDAPQLTELHLRPYLPPSPEPLSFANGIATGAFARDLGEKVRVGLKDHWNVFETLRAVWVPKEVEMGVRPRGLLAAKGIQLLVEEERRGVKVTAEEFVRLFDMAEVEAEG